MPSDHDITAPQARAGFARDSVEDYEGPVRAAFATMVTGHRITRSRRSPDQEMIPILFPTRLKISSDLLSWSPVWVAVMMVRRRALPSATVG